LGRYYSTQGSDLYIWVTGEDELIDLNVFPPGLNIFEADSAWRSSQRMAVSEGVGREALGVAEMILKYADYGAVEADRDSLEDYFVQGDEKLIRVVIPVVPMRRAQRKRAASVQTSSRFPISRGAS
jgi:hypothetical protein